MDFWDFPDFTALSKGRDFRPLLFILCWRTKLQIHAKLMLTPIALNTLNFHSSSSWFIFFF